jgi:hypothetical protein
MVEMLKDKKNAKLYGMIIGLLLGLGVGLALDNIAIGAGIGIPYGIIIGKVLSGEELVKDKKTRRMVSWSMLSLSILGCLLFGYIVGDIVLGLTAGIGFSFVVGLKWEKLYDERMSSMFSKAARNAFVVVNAGLSFVLIFGQGMEASIIANMPLGEQLKYVIYLSWVIFLVSWLYHANYKGE